MCIAACVAGVIIIVVSLWGYNAYQNKKEMDAYHTKQAHIQAQAEAEREEKESIKRAEVMAAQKRKEALEAKIAAKKAEEERLARMKKASADRAIDAELKRVSDLMATFASSVSEDDAYFLIILEPCVRQLKYILAMEEFRDIDRNLESIGLNINKLHERTLVFGLIIGKEDKLNKLEKMSGQISLCLTPLMEANKEYTKMYKLMASQEKDEKVNGEKVTDKEIITAYSMANYQAMTTIIGYNSVAKNVKFETVREQMKSAFRTMIRSFDSDGKLGLHNIAKEKAQAALDFKGRVKGATLEDRIAYTLAQRYISIKMKVSSAPELFNVEYGMHGYDNNYRSVGDRYNGPGKGPASQVLDYGAYLEYLEFRAMNQDAMVFCIKGNYVQNGTKKPFVMAICYDKNTDKALHVKFAGSWYGESPFE